MSRSGFNLKCRPELRQRAELAAEAQGLNLAEFVRVSVLSECERVERLTPARRRAAARAGQGARA